MNYPPSRWLTAEEVDIIWNKALEKRNETPSNP